MWFSKVVGRQEPDLESVSKHKWFGRSATSADRNLLSVLCLICCLHPCHAVDLGQLAGEKLPVVYCLETDVRHARHRFGTGIQILPGTMLTVWHEIEGGKRIEVFSNDNLRSPARLLEYDPTLDLALLEIAPRTGKVLVNEVSLQRGSEVVAIGCPLGGDQTPHAGIILDSGKNIEGVDLVELSMPVAKGDSGAPLFDGQGFLVGLIRGYAVGDEDVSYAIPAGDIVRFLAKAGVPVDEVVTYSDIRKLIEQGADEAEVLLLAHTAKRQADYRPYLLLGLYYEGREEYPRALTWLIEAAERDTHRVEIFEGLCRLYSRIKFTDAETHSCAYAKRLKDQGNGRTAH